MDNKKNNQTNPLVDTQDILNQYSSSIKPETSEKITKNLNEDNPINDADENKIEEPEIKMLEVNKNTPTPVSLSDNFESPKSIIDNNIPITEDKSELTPEPEKIVQPQPEPQPELKNPQEIKQKIEEVLSYNTKNDNDTIISQIDKPKSSALLKTLFFLSLIIFIGVAVALGYFYFNPLSKNNSDTKIVNNPTPTIIQTGATCELNGFVYNQDQSFPSADGCNTCSCDSSGEIVCTEKACADVTSTPATSSSIPKDWKTYTNKTFGVSFQYPVNYEVNINTTLGELYVTEITENMAAWFNIIKVNNEDLTTFIKNNSEYKKIDFMIGNQKGVRFRTTGPEEIDFIYLTTKTSNYKFLTELSFDDPLFTQILSTVKFN